MTPGKLLQEDVKRRRDTMKYKRPRLLCDHLTLLDASEKRLILHSISACVTPTSLKLDSRQLLWISTLHCLVFAKSLNSSHDIQGQLIESPNSLLNTDQSLF